MAAYVTLLDEVKRLSAEPDFAFQHLFTPSAIGFLDSDFLERGHGLFLRPSDVLSRDDCVRVIRAWVSHGTIIGWVLPRSAKALLLNRLRTPTVAHPSGIDDQHLATSFSQSLEGAIDIFAEWHGEGNRNLYYTATKNRLANLRADPAYATATTDLLVRYGQVLASPESVTDRPLPATDPYSFASVQLSSPVVEAAILSTAQLKALEPAVFGTTRLSDDLTHLKTTWEFFNFYGHLLDRSAFAALGTARRDKIIDAFLPHATRVLAVAMWPEASEQFQQDVARESQANFNQAQGEYGPCQVLLSADPSDAEENFPKALASRLYQNIARSLGGDPQGLYPVVVTILQEHTSGMDLDAKVRAIERSLT